MKSAQLGPWTKGLINTVPPEKVPSDGLVFADNVDVDRAGAVSRRDAWVRVDTDPARSLFRFGGATYGVVDGNVGRLDGAGFTSLAPANGHVSWAVLNGAPIFCNSVGVYAIQNGVAAQLDSTIFADDEDDELAPDRDLMLAPLPGGQALAYWQGRVLVARGTTLIFSEPIRYGVYDQLRSFIRFEEQISWIAALQQGIYVGLRNSVRFLSGSNYADLTQLVVAGPSWRRSGVVTSTEAFDTKLVNGAPYVAVWMSDRGFAIGLPSGAVVYPQAERLKEIPLGEGKVVVLGDRITVLGA